VFKPTPLVQVIGQTIEFFKQIKPNQYLKEKRAVLNELPKELRKQIIKTIQDHGAFLQFGPEVISKEMLKKLNDSYRSSSSSSDSSSDSSSTTEEAKE
jgi:hypothetical protein